MSRLRVKLEAIQHVTSLYLDIDLTANGLMCLVGRNGAGKTTLVRALKNLSNADTFVKTATPYAFSADSRIVYDLDGVSVVFAYDAEIRSLNCHDPIPYKLRNLVAAELPMPHGSRFNSFQSASEADLDIRKTIALGTYSTPDELISFLNAVYESTRYSAMAEVKSRGKSYYALVRTDGTYIREDYLSSGEHFLINLYRTIKGPAKLLVIDEIDISLDAAAQANLTAWLRAFCAQYGCKIIFTTHSLALMRQLEVDELFYMEERGGEVSISPTSYSHAIAMLFGFIGYDRYILTEDKMLVSFIHHLIQKYCPETILRYKVIFIGGASQVSELLEANEAEEFLASPEKVVAILDADQRNEKFAGNVGIHMIPLDSVEEAILTASYEDVDFPFRATRRDFTKGKDFNHYLKQQGATQEEIFDYLIARHESAFKDISDFLLRFIPPPHS
ncbi:ABC-type Mn2+/Zn2+ transport system ATPase subunit [Lysobacter enzymogenes]|jgi:ABC-type Mn2+/Zn2+ transport system ATPase subunit|uniref:AAA family ATPase n=1 Tax=Lysobacter enzymogenes TaxID=69 RepID=UPI003390FC62